MATECERWFLTKKIPDLTGCIPLTIVQGYMSRADGGPLVRIRIQDGDGYLTIKGKGDGLSRPEFEYKIPLYDALEMLDEFCPKLRIEKTRYRIPHGDLTIELDVFSGPLAGLIKAEVELPTPTTPFTPPDWFGEEVTGRYEYSNVRLAECWAERWPETKENPA